MKLKTVVATLIVIEFFLASLFLFENVNFELLNPKGLIARQQKELMIVSVAIMLIVAIPLLYYFYYIAFKYGKKDESHNLPYKNYGVLHQFVWWAIPAITILVLALITWERTHALDPYKPIVSNKEPVRIQVVALRWKWLFLYPDYNIATVNFVQFPEDTPINFELTAEAPMNSFWIPSLSGQIYAMTGMSTKLHIVADKEGDYRGQAAEINGRGFSGMKFIARASKESDFYEWVERVRDTQNPLSEEGYNKLSIPSENNPVELFSSFERDLYNRIIRKFMPPKGDQLEKSNTSH